MKHAYGTLTEEFFASQYQNSGPQAKNELNMRSSGSKANFDYSPCTRPFAFEPLASSANQGEVL